MQLTFLPKTEPLKPKDYRKLPEKPGVYLMLNEERNIIYVGKAKSLKSRVSSYFVSSKQQAPKTKKLVSKIAFIEFSVCSSEFEALLLEQVLIRKHQPKFNILLRDDKSYPFVYLTLKHDFPAVLIKRVAPQHNPKILKNSDAFGPFGPQRAKVMVDMMSRFLGIRTCTDSEFKRRTRACLKHEIGRCSAPCVGLISKENYQERSMLSRQFLKGETTSLLKKLKEKQLSLAKEEHFEEAARMRDFVHTLSKLEEESEQSIVTKHQDSDVWALSKASYHISVYLLVVRSGQVKTYRQFHSELSEDVEEETLLIHYVLQYYASIPKDLRAKELVLSLSDEGKEQLTLAFLEFGFKSKILTKPQGNKKKWLKNAESSAKVYAKALCQAPTSLDSLNEMATLLNLDEIRTLACVDISHQGGRGTVGSYVVSEDGELKKDSYRLINSKESKSFDDYAAMNYVIKEAMMRAKNKESGFVLPDVLVVDGGLGQLKSAYEALLEAQLTTPLFLIGSAKGATRKAGDETLYKLQFTPHTPMKRAELFLLSLSHRKPLWQIQSEAHRFAIGAGRKSHQKRVIQSKLDSVQGVGVKTKGKLLNIFHSVSKIKDTNPELIAQEASISLSLAKKIVHTLNEAEE